MFNDLNPQQNPPQSPPQNNRQAVDDIFAETDKPVGNSAGNIETHRVGLTSLNEGAPLTPPEETQKPKWPLFKISAIVIVAAILILSGYLVYSKFFKTTAEIVDTTVVSKAPVTNIVPETNTNTVVSPSSVSTTSVETPGSVYVSEIPGLASSTLTTSGTSTEVVTPLTPTSTLDSDNDGLTDEEEKLYNTNPLVVDTDSDGLSDYEEIKIYHTNPLISDTDGDTYLDGAEVKNGYNPNGPGKMPGVNAVAPAVK